MNNILEPIFKGLLQWAYNQVLEIVEYIANSLLDVFSMDLHYFETAVPIADTILTIVIATGWALLLGNLVFQASKSMMSGLGFESEDPKTLFARTFVFAFFLLASRQVCSIGLGISNMLITILQIPGSLSMNMPTVNMFTIAAAWLMVIIVGFVLMWQLVKLFFAIGERYFLLCLLTILAPWAFATGGSRNTSDIFKGWARMYGSMCLMMVLNVVLLKILLSAMGMMPSGVAIIPWLIFLVAVARGARKIENVILRIGLNPAPTGGQGRGLPGMLSYIVMRTVMQGISSAAGKSAGGAGGAGRARGAHSAAGSKGFAFNRGAGARSAAPHNVTRAQSANTGASQQTVSPQQTVSSQQSVSPQQAVSVKQNVTGSLSTQANVSSQPLTPAGTGAAGINSAGKNTAGNTEFAGSANTVSPISSPGKPSPREASAPVRDGQQEMHRPASRV